MIYSKIFNELMRKTYAATAAKNSFPIFCSIILYYVNLFFFFIKINLLHNMMLQLVVIVNCLLFELTTLLNFAIFC
jgi:hypothetical protein